MNTTGTLIPVGILVKFLINPFRFSFAVARSGKNVSTLLVTLEDNSHVLVKTEKETEEKG